MVASAIFYGVAFWGSSISAADRRRLNKLVKKARSVLGYQLDTVEVVGDRRMTAKLSSLMDNTFHPMRHALAALSSSFSHQLIHPERFRRSFLAAVRLYNHLCSQ